MAYIRAHETNERRKGRPIKRYEVVWREPVRDSFGLQPGRVGLEVGAQAGGVRHGGAHHLRVLAHPLDHVDRPQPSPERLRDDCRVGRRLSRLRGPHPARERDDRYGAARRGLEHILGRQEPQRAG